LKYLFGPIISRRLGNSLGIDIVPMKTCTLDCIYCECGKSSQINIEPREYIPSEEIIKEIRNYLKNNSPPDFFTFSGGGEPTLNSGIGKIIDFIKDINPNLKIALITNGTLLVNPEVRRKIIRADVIMPSMDAVSANIFNKINRPAKGISPDDIIDGIDMLKKESAAEVWVEVFLIPGINDMKSELRLIKEALLKISPDRVQLNTLDRPALYKNIQPLSAAKLSQITKFMQPLNTEVIAAPIRVKIDSLALTPDEILHILSRRPLTLEDMRLLFPGRDQDLKRCLQELEISDKITRKLEERGEFFKLK